MKRMLFFFILIFSISSTSRAGETWGGESKIVEPLKLQRTEEVVLNKEYNVTEKRAVFNLGTAFIRTVKLSDSISNAKVTLSISGKKLKLQESDGKTIRSEIIVDQKTVIPEGVILLETESETLVIGQPRVTKKIRNGIREEQPSNVKFEIAPNSLGYSITVRITSSKKCECEAHFWAVKSYYSLFEGDYEPFMAICEQSKKAKQFIAPEGYFYKMDQSYSPWSENSFYLNPSAYTANLLSQYMEHTFSKLSLEALLRLMDTQINEKGFIPMGNSSLWLLREYKIPALYYDTRWNCDLGYHYLSAYEKNGVPEDLISAKKLISYFMYHSKTRNFPIKDGLKDGIFVCDYSSENSPAITHCSLNHQLMGIKLLYKAYLIFSGEAPNKKTPESFENREELLDLAKKMLGSIEITRSSWIRTNNDLHYAIFPNFSYGLDDYPDLTYSDLLEVQELHRQIFGTPNYSLDFLIESKKKFLGLT